MEFLKQLVEFLFLGSLPTGLTGKIVFVTASAVFGVLIFLADYAFFTFDPRKRSLFNMKPVYVHPGILHRLGACFLWSLASGIVAFLGEIAEVLQVSRIAALAAAISWPIILSKIADLRDK